MSLFGTSTVRSRAQGGAVVVEVRGDCDIEEAPAVRDALARAVDEGTGCVVVDLSRTTLVSSALLATMLNALRRLTRLGRPMVVVGGPAVERTLRLTRLDDTFRLCADVESALRRCAGSSPAAA